MKDQEHDSTTNETPDTDHEEAIPAVFDDRAAQTQELEELFNLSSPPESEGLAENQESQGVARFRDDRHEVVEAADDGIWTTTKESPGHSISRLIRTADQDEHVWHIEGLWKPNTITLVHSLEGEFKSILAYQVSEALATGQPLLRKWKVPEAVRVGVLQTEMADNLVGERLKAMYPDGRIPANLIVSNEGLGMHIRQSMGANNKFRVIHQWLTSNDIEVLVWDTINSVLASCGNPNSEEAAAYFYNQLESLPHRGALVVRHDGKPSSDSEMRQSNQKVRGSNLHAEIASAIVHLRRLDKRSNRVILEVGKLRHDVAGDPTECWFDAGTMRLTLLPPPVALLAGH